MHIEYSLSATLTQLRFVLSQLSHEEYKRSLPVLNNSSIGQHTRHVIEFLQTLRNGYNSGVINYDKRIRNSVIENDLGQALDALSNIGDSVFMDDKELLLIGSYSNDVTDETTVRTSYYREIVYNLEHAIHHMAMIRIAVSQSTNLVVPSDFGIAPATIHHRRSTA